MILTAQGSFLRDDIFVFIGTHFSIRPHHATNKAEVFVANFCRRVEVRLFPAQGDILHLPLPLQDIVKYCIQVIRIGWRGGIFLYWRRIKSWVPPMVLSELQDAGLVEGIDIHHVMAFASEHIIKWYVLWKNMEEI